MLESSETLRVVPCLSNSFKSVSNEKFNEWLAGLIDGDGHFRVEKNKYGRFVIVMGINDYQTLLFIKEKLGSGSVTLISGKQAYWYRLCNTAGMIDLVNRINGNIRNSKRVPQFITLSFRYTIYSSNIIDH